MLRYICCLVYTKVRHYLGDLDVDGKILTFVRQRKCRGGLELWLELGYWILRTVISLI